MHVFIYIHHACTDIQSQHLIRYCTCMHLVYRRFKVFEDNCQEKNSYPYVYKKNWCWTGTCTTSWPSLGGHLETCPRDICKFRRTRAGRPWIQCTKFAQWVHCFCAGITLKDAESMPKWLCHTCE